MFRGVVLAINDVTADVQFDDGELRQGMPLSALRLERPQPLPMGAPLPSPDSNPDEVLYVRPPNGYVAGDGRSAEALISLSSIDADAM